MKYKQRLKKILIMTKNKIKVKHQMLMEFLCITLSLLHY